MARVGKRKRVANDNDDDDSFIIHSSSDEDDGDMWSDGDYCPTSEEDATDADDDGSDEKAKEMKNAMKKKKKDKKSSSKKKKKFKEQKPKDDYYDIDDENEDDDEEDLESEAVAKIATTPRNFRMVVPKVTTEKTIHKFHHHHKKKEAKRLSKEKKKRALVFDSYASDDNDDDIPLAQFVAKANKSTKNMMVTAEDEDEGEELDGALQDTDEEDGQHGEGKGDFDSSEDDDSQSDRKKPSARKNTKEPRRGRYSLRNNSPRQKPIVRVAAKRPTIFDSGDDRDNYELSSSDDQEERLHQIRVRNDEYHQEVWDREHKWDTINENRRQRKLFGKRKPPVQRQLHTRGFYCCPICYVEAYRRIKFPHDNCDDDDSDGGDSNLDVEGEGEEDQIADLEVSAFEYGPIEILESLGGGQMKPASAICFFQVVDVKNHLRVDHGIDAKGKDGVRKNDLFMRFHTSKSDGLLQRYQNRKGNMTGLGHMSRYWDEHNKEQAKALDGYMKRRNNEDNDEAQQLLSTFPLRAQRIWQLLRQAYCNDNGNAINDGHFSCSDDDESNDVSETGITDHINHDLLDRQDQQEEAAEELAYLENLKKRCKDETIPVHSEEEEDEEDHDDGKGDDRSSYDGNQDDEDRDEDSSASHYDNQDDDDDDEEEEEEAAEEEGDDQGDTLMGFGKYQDKTYHWVLTHEHGYVDWCMGQGSNYWKMENFQNYARLFRQTR